MQKFLFFLFFTISLNAAAQKIYGVVYNSSGDLLPNASISIKGTTIGSCGNNNARFSINIVPGKYTIICQHIGFATQEKNIEITNNPEELIFILPKQKLSVKEKAVNKNKEEAAYTIIKKVIKKRNFNNNQSKKFECNLYTKNIIKTNGLLNKIVIQNNKTPLDSAGLGIIYLSELSGKIFSDVPDKFKLIVDHVSEKGNGDFVITFPTLINFYQNNVTVFNENLNPHGFVSPIANTAFKYYYYKFLGSFWENGKEINSILVIPRHKHAPLFYGIINISENDWRIHSVSFLLTKKEGLVGLDTLQITQYYIAVNDSVSEIKNQLLKFNFKKLNINAIGNCVSIYSNYLINQSFNKNFFNKVAIQYEANVNQTNTTFWDSTRQVPMSNNEVKADYLKNKLVEINDASSLSKLQIDSLNNAQGKIKNYNLFLKGIDRMQYSKPFTYNWRIDPLLENVEYNLAEGIVVNVNTHFNKYINSIHSTVFIDPIIRYGINNTHLNPAITITFKNENFYSNKKSVAEIYSFAGGKRVSQFNKDCPISQDINSISTLLSGKNFMKTYENYFGDIRFSKKYDNGFTVNLNALYEDRIPLNNTTNFILFKKYKNHITPNYPDEKIATQFTRYQATILKVGVSYWPRQKYIQYPNGKVSLGSMYPLFSINYTKGINHVFGSSVDFDKWNFSIKNELNFKLAGLLKYNFIASGFLNTHSVFIQDYTHINGNEYFAASEYLNSFQLANYYTNSNTEKLFTEAHVEYHLNGLLSNKIPIFKNYNWNFIVGSNVFYINKNSNYTEIFFGIENILHVLRVDFIASFQEGKTGETGIRIGTQAISTSQNKAQRQTPLIKF